MKNLLVVLVALGVSFAISSCSKQSKSPEFEEFKMFVESHKDSADQYLTQSWEDIQQQYNLKEQRVQENLDQMSEGMKNEFNQLKEQWKEFKNNYQQKKDEQMAPEMEAFHRSLLPADVALNFGNVGSERLFSVYEYFVNTVKKNQEIYTREQWDQAELLYERLDAYKNSVEKDLPKGDNNKIGALKVEYSAIKTLHRPSEKTVENEEAKEQAK